jgi:uncharacterized membrane protein
MNRPVLYRGLEYGNAARRLALFIMTVVCCLCPVAMFGASTITYVQGAYATPQTPQTTVKVTFTAAQTAGNLNVVVVGWNDTSAAVNSVQDSKGNVYVRAIGPTILNSYLSQSIYYAKNIAAASPGGNTVTVTFSQPAVYPDIRILEYSGADINNPVDVTAGASGMGATSSSGSVTTTNPTDLLFGANMVFTMTSGPGTGFTSRMITSPDGDIAEDMMVTTTGNYSATAPVRPSERWVMQMVAFRTGPNFTIGASPSSLTIIQGNQGASTITTAISGGFNSAITLSAAGVPTGTTVSFNPNPIAAPGSGTSTMTITVGANAAVGTYPITVTGNGGGSQQSTTVTLTVAAQQQPDFTISALPVSLSVAQGKSGTSAITTAISGGFNSAITLSATGVPTGTTVSFSPNPIAAPGSGTSTMTITVGANTAIGTYPITVSGSGGSVQHSTTVTLTVTAPANFTIAASPNSVTVVQGNQGISTITTTISGGFNSAITLSATGVPIGTSVSFSPNPIAAPGSGTSTMTITVGANTAIGTYPITVSGSGGSVQHSTTVTLTVTAPADFTIAASPNSVTVVQGNQGTSTITTAISGGFNSAIMLSAAGVPTGTTVSFNPNPIAAPGSGTSTMTITVGANTAVGTYPITVTGSGGSVQHNTTVTLTVTAPAGFTIAASPNSLAIRQGNQGTSTITATISGGFNNSIAFSASGAPAGSSVAFNPNPIPAPGNGSSTMTITVGANTAVGTYPLTVTGSGGVTQQTTVVTLNVTSATSTISYIQGSYSTPQTPQTTVNVTYTAAQIAGDLNVVVVGWNDSSAAVTSVSDSKGNTYVRAIGPTSVGGTLSQSIYYCPNILSAAGGSNIVTVKFTQAAIYPDIRILEYSGLDPNVPVDVIAGSTGNSSNSNSGSVTTTNPVDLLFGANIVLTSTIGPGSGFNSRMITSPDGDIAEDQVVMTTGSYSASAPLSSGVWVMQMVAFRANTNGGPVLTSIAVTPVNPVIKVSDHQQFTATGTYSDNSHKDLTNSALWTSSLPTVASINSTGFAIGVAAGTTVIQAAVGGISGSTNLTVTAGFAVSPRAAVVTFAQTQQFTATAGFGNVTWLVDGVAGGSPTTGTITSNGLYTPPGAVGSHTVTATTDQQQSANSIVYVTNYPGTFTYHNDNLRSGQNTNETVLTPANVNSGQFGKLFSYPLDGIAFASPLYVANVNIPGTGVRNVVYVATEHDTVYAFNADGLSGSPFWQVSFLMNGATTVPCADTGECGDIPGEIGITGTPAIDPASGTLYVVAATKENGGYVQRLHALDLSTGAEKFGGPTVIAGSVPGTGGGSVGGQVPFDPLRENQRSGLLLNNGVIYIAFGSHGDVSPWHGWILGYNAATLQQVLIYNATPNGSGGGIWQGGSGLATDTSGNIYFVTGNGDFDVNIGGVDYGDTIGKLAPNGSIVDYFTPYDQLNMNVNDLDLGSAGPVLLVDQLSGPYPHLLISAGKGGTIYVINRDNMGHYNANNDNQIVQSLVGALKFGGAGSGNFSAPVFFNNYVYYAARNDTIKAFQLSNGLLSATPTSQSAEIYAIRGGSFSASANGSANGILWALQNNGNSPNDDVGAPGILFAYDATNLANELYNSAQAGSRDTLDFAVKFSIPLIANGKVFIAGQSQLTVFGLLP